MSICNRTQQECRNPQLCLAHGCPGTLPNYFAHVKLDPPVAQQPDRLKEGANAIRARIKEERKLYANYLVHVDRMKEQEDLHGGWDAFANASEVSNRIDMLEWCLGQLGEAV